jgi:hypothetical protein
MALAGYVLRPGGSFAFSILHPCFAGGKDISGSWPLRRHDLWLEQIVKPLPAPDWDQAHDADRKPVYLAARSVKVIGR